MADEESKSTVTEQEQSTAAATESAAAQETFTQADVDRIVAQRLARAQKDAEARVRAARDEGFSEAEKLAKMTEQQRAEHDKAEAEKARKAHEDELRARESDVTRRELRMSAVERLTEMKLPAGLADLLSYTDADACDQSLKTVEKLFREAVQAGVDEKLAAAKNPIRRGGSNSEAEHLKELRRAMGLKD